jgi:hypothetical protein
MLVLGRFFWHTGAGEPSPPPPPQADDNFGGFGYRPSGGFPAQDQRSPEDVRRARQRFGVIPPDALEVIEAVATRQALAQQEADEQKRFEELSRELELRRIEFDARYLEVLAALREENIAELKRQNYNQEVLMLLMLAAAAVQ